MRVRLPRRFFIFLAAGFIGSCKTVAPGGPVFPVPDRPVAPIVSPVYSNETTRDRNGEAERVMDRLAIEPGVRVADLGAGQGYYTVRLVRRLGSSGTVYAEDVRADYLKGLEARLDRERAHGARLILGRPNDPRLAPNSIDVALLAYMYHEIKNPYEFFYRLQPALAANARVGVIDVDRPTQVHGTPPALLRCELEAVGYRQVDFLSLAPADGYLAIFVPLPQLPAVLSITPCKNNAIGNVSGGQRR